MKRIFEELTAKFMPFDFELDVLVLHQREQRFLRHDAAHVRLAADLRADLVDFVDEDDAVLDGAKQIGHRRVRAEARARVREKPPEHCPPISLMLLGQHIRIDANDVRGVAQLRPAGEKLLDRAHERGLARTGVADQQHVRRGMADQMLDDGDGELADGLILPDDSLAQRLEDLARTEGKGVHGRGIVANRQAAVHSDINPQMTQMDAD